jgi:polar amino acid transport system substrate-binding protein
LIANKLGKEAVFENMQFSTIFAALQNDSVDAAISTITITAEREKNFDFSNGYYKESMAMVYPNNKPLTNKSQLAKKKIACQLGTTMEIWLKKHAPDTEILAMDSNNQAVEALKANHVDGALVDSAQGAVFSKKNAGLAYSVIAQSDTGYGIAVKKGSPLKEEINTILTTLEKSGELEKIKLKWLGPSK